jgi:hypothetical protein
MATAYDATVMALAHTFEEMLEVVAKKDEALAAEAAVIADRALFQTPAVGLIVAMSEREAYVARTFGPLLDSASIDGLGKHATKLVELSIIDLAAQTGEGPMPAGKRRRFLGSPKASAAGAAFHDPAFAQRLWDAAAKGLDALEGLTARRAAWMGKAEPLPAAASSSRPRKLFSWPPFARPRDEVADRAAEIMADLEAVTSGRPMASPELAKARSEASQAQPRLPNLRAGKAA